VAVAVHGVPALPSDAEDIHHPCGGDHHGGVAVVLKTGIKGNLNPGFDPTPAARCKPP
jgi:hypothetical protein